MSKIHCFFFTLTTIILMPLFYVNAQSNPLDANIPRLEMSSLTPKVEVGDIVFTRIDILPFRKIARDTGSWTNHVGIIIDTSGDEPIVAESTFPFSKATQLTKFIKRSENGRLAIQRLNTPLTSQQREDLKAAALKRFDVLYDTGFNLNSRRQFCSRYVREVIHEATGATIGDTQNFKALFANNPNADLFFWRLWYFTMIPWDRETVTPASMLKSANLHAVFDGYISLN